MIRTKHYASTEPFDLNQTGTPRLLWDCADMVSASVQVCPAAAGAAYVLTVIVSNDPSGAKYESHPSTITLTASARITSVFSVVGFRWFGVALTTPNGAALRGDVFGVAKDSPA